MTLLKQPVLSPIRFYDPNLSFGSFTTFQHPDNRVTHGYNWEGVHPFPYALPIPKQWPDGQPGIDFLINSGAIFDNFYAKLYDEDDADFADLIVDTWSAIDSGIQWRVWLDGLSGDGVDDGMYTIKLFDTTDDALLLESEPLIIAPWFDDMIPFEFSNFENDFGMVFDNASTLWTGRMMMPVRIYDPRPTFEKETYKNDPGILTTLRTIPQREFNFDTLVLPGHRAETFQLAFSCSELYLDRIKIDSEELPEGEVIEGSNMKQLSGTATFVDFNNDYVREVVETSQVDQNIDWASETYPTAVITGNEVAISDATLPGGGPYDVTSESISYSDGDLVLIKIEIKDFESASIPPSVSFDSVAFTDVLEFGINWLSYRVNATSSDTFRFRNVAGDRAIFTIVIDVYIVE